MDNFDHKERTDSGGDVSNDTVLVIWQNGKEDDIEPRRMSKRDNTKYAVECRQKTKSAAHVTLPAVNDVAACKKFMRNKRGVLTDHSSHTQELNFD